MDPVPEKFYYVPLPRLPRVRLARLPRPRLQELPSYARPRLRRPRVRPPALPGPRVFNGLVACARGWRRTRKGARSWWSAHRLDVALCVFGLACALAVALIARGLA